MGILRKTCFALLLLLFAVFAVGSQEGADRFWERVDGLLNTVEERLSPPSTRSEAAPRSFSVRNDTPFIIVNIFIRRAGDTSWGDNILQQPLYSGRSFAVRLGESFDGTSLYSIRMVDIDGDRYTKYDIIIEERSTIPLGVGDFEFEK